VVSQISTKRSYMKTKIFTIGLVAILIVSIGVGLVIYFQNQEIRQMNSYSIVGTLNFAPDHAIYPGISAVSVSPNVSPEPKARTFTEANGSNETVASFVFLNFSSKFTFPSNSTGYYPQGFVQGDVAKVSGEMSYDNTLQGYVMNVTYITHYYS
jgi:hypothetical protein